MSFLSFSQRLLGQIESAAHSAGSDLAQANQPFVPAEQAVGRAVHAVGHALVPASLGQTGGGYAFTPLLAPLFHTPQEISQAAAKPASPLIFGGLTGGVAPEAGQPTPGLLQRAQNLLHPNHPTSSFLDIPPELPPPPSSPTAGAQNALDSFLTQNKPLPPVDAAAKAASAVPPTAFQKASAALQHTIIDPFTENLKVLQSTSPTGEALAKTVRSTYSQAAVDTGKALDSVVQPLKKLSAADQANFVDVVEGRGQANTPQVQAVVDAYTPLRQDIAQKADQQGLFQYGPRADYFPHSINKDWVINPKNAEAIQNNFVTTGQAPDIGTARSMYQNLQDATTGKGQYFAADGRLIRQQSNLDFSRSEAQLPPEAYINDPVKNLSQYVSGAYKRLNEAAAFGPNGEKLPDYLNQITQEGGNAETAAGVMKQILEPPAPGKVPPALTQFGQNESALHLGTSFIKHATQPTMTITTEGLTNTLKGAARLITDPASAAATAIQSGSRTPELLQEAGTTTSNLASKLPWIKALGGVRTLNQTLAANAAEFGVNSMVQRLLKDPNDALATRLLTKNYGLDPAQIVKQGGLQGDQLLQAIHEGVTTSQYRYRPQDLPSTLTGSDAKFFGRFKSFAFKQTQAVMNNVVKEALAGNATPLVRFITAGTVLGEGANAALQGIKTTAGAVTGNKPADRPTGGARLLQDLDTAGGGMATEAAKQILGGTSSAYQWIFGPTVSDLVGLATNVGKTTGLATNNGRPVKANAVPLAQQAAQFVPYVGGGLSKDLAPSTTGTRHLPTGGRSAVGATVPEHY